MKKLYDIVTLRSGMFSLLTIVGVATLLAWMGNSRMQEETTLVVADASAKADAVEEEQPAEQAPASFVAEEEPGNAASMAPAVDVMIVQPQNSRIWKRFSGRIQAVDRVEVRPRVSGEITKVLFKEGSVIEEGAPLFVIDPRPFEADVASARAALSSAMSRRDLAKIEVDRAKLLVEKKVVSQSRLDEAASAYQVAKAAVSEANAQLKQSLLDVEYAHVKAPVKGRVSRAEITVGNVVQGGQNAPVLTTIVSNDKMYADFDVDEQTYVTLVRQVQASTQGAAEMPVMLSLQEDDRLYHGKIASFDNQLDATSGTIRARAVFENTDGVLVPGMYANVQLGSADEQSLLLVSEKAIGTDQNKKFVYVITPEHMVSYREIHLGGSVRGTRIVTQGLQAGEMVMVNSLQRVQPDMKVRPVDVSEGSGKHTNPEASSTPL